MMRNGNDLSLQNRSASPEYFAEYAKQFLEARVSALGGCCGTTPEHIRKMGGSILLVDTGRKSSAVIRHIDQTETLKDSVPVEKRSSLGHAFINNEWITSIELVPPISSDLSVMEEKAKILYRNNITCIDIPDGPRVSSGISPMITAIEIEKLAKIETILHYCCRDRNLIGIQSDLLGAHAACYCRCMAPCIIQKRFIFK
ncbi:MAG: hypothetical protein GXP33_07855 [Spirochaetes bacterium]|nr:hypothetical protein [Spirochaetota bacterium]